jgi:hypothetical protein
MGNIIQNNETGSEAEQQAQEKVLAENILSNFELPESLTQKIDETVKKEDEDVAEEPVEEKEAEVAEDAVSEKAEDGAKTETEEKEDEELIPKSTFQKRLDEMTREKRALELRLKRLEEQQTQQKPAKDEDMIKLEQMSESELVSLKKQTRLAQLKNASDDAMVTKLMELEDKIDLVRMTAPQRLAQNQVQRFNEAVAISAPEIQNFDKVQKDIFSLAKQIYDTTPELHTTVSGQASAWNLAVSHYKLMQEAHVGKTKVAELDRQVNTLKKKVSLDGVSRKATSEPDSDVKVFKRAKNGTTGDKLEFFRKRLGTDEVVDSFMGAR